MSIMVATIRPRTAAALLFVSGLVHGAPVGLDLRAEALVHGNAVRLGDVAIIDAEPDTARRLAALRVANAPLAGYADSLSRAALEAALRTQPAFAWLAPTWAGAARVVVRRASSTVAGERLRAAAQHHLESTHGARYARLELTALGSVADVQVPEGVLALRARAVATLQARTAVWIDLLVDGALVRSAVVPFQARAWDAVPVARRDLAADALLAQSDVRLEQRDLLALASAPAAAAAAREGARLGIAVAAGDVLPARAMVPAGAVRRGDRVRLLVHDAGVRIETMAVAQEDAGAGAPVRVMPAAANVAVSARVVGQGLVAIEGL